MKLGDRSQAVGSSKSSLPKAYDVEAREREERKRKRRDGEDGREGEDGRDELDSFPVMMSFKAFLETQDDSITDEEALIKYGEYKMEFKRQKINEFFVSHKSQEWFRSKYHPQEFSDRQTKEEKVSSRRWQIFKDLLDKGFFDGVSCSADQETEIVKLLDSVVILLEDGNYEDIKNLDLEENNNDHIKHKSSSIFIRNLHPSLTRTDLLALVEKYPGFQRLAISEADCKNNFSRRCWVSFQRNAKIREICYAINNTQIKGIDMQAVVNKDLSKRSRTCEPLVSHPSIIKKDLKIAMDIIKFQDARQGLWKVKAAEVTEGTENTENVPPESNQENAEQTDKPEENPPKSEQQTTLKENPLLEEALSVGEEVEDMRAMLDKLVLYLRIVHSIDFYSQKDYRGEDDMPNRCGLIHIRSNNEVEHNEAEVDKLLKTREEAFKPFTSNPAKVEESEAKKLGLKDEEFEIDKFVSANSQELAKDKWLCTLSGKKFKALEFIRKHIFNKFPEKVDEVKTEVKFFNNYILDPERPQLPEEKLQPPPKVKKMRSEAPAPVATPPAEKKGIHARLGVREEPPPRNAVRVTYAATDPRGLIDYSDIDSSIFDVFG